MLIREKLRKLFLGKFTQLWTDRFQYFFAQLGCDSGGIDRCSGCRGWGRDGLGGGFCGLDEFGDSLHLEEFRDRIDSQTAKFTATGDTGDHQTNDHGPTGEDDWVFQQFNGLCLEGIEGDLPLSFGGWIDLRCGGVFRHEIRGKEATM